MWKLWINVESFDVVRRSIVGDYALLYVGMCLTKNNRIKAACVWVWLLAGLFFGVNKVVVGMISIICVLRIESGIVNMGRVNGSCGA